MRFGPRLRGSTPVSQWLGGGGGGRIRSIQRGTIAIAGAATSNTATINTVDLPNTRLVWLGVDDDSGDVNSNAVAVRLALTNATTVTATVQDTAGAARNVTFEVIEYYSGAIRSVQRGTLTTTGAGAGTATIASVDTTKATLENLGFTTPDVLTNPGSALASLILTNATTVTLNALGNIDRIAGYQVVEWY